jgi:hypothetical protein
MQGVRKRLMTVSIFTGLPTLTLALPDPGDLASVLEKRRLFTAHARSRPWIQSNPNVVLGSPLAALVSGI